MSIYQIAWYFLIYSFIGWGVEVIYQAVSKGKIINRGFLAGPVCPIYGFGIISVFLLTEYAVPVLSGLSSEYIYSNNDLVQLLVIFAGGILVATLIEFLGGWILDKIFHARWWDYRNEPFNIGGYICPKFSILWGLAVVIVVRVVQPVVMADAAPHIPEKYGVPILAALYLVLAVDFGVTVMILAGLNKRLRELDRMRAELSRVSSDLSTRLGESTLEIRDNLEEAKGRREELREMLKDAEESGADFKEMLGMAGAMGEEFRDEWKKDREESLRRKKEKLEEGMAHARKALLYHRLFGAGRLFHAFPLLMERFGLLQDEPENGDLQEG